MSILIKGMEMPSCCDECRFLSEYGDYPVCILTDEQRGYNFRIRELKMPHCPIIEIPPHGRLIDAERIYDAVEQRYRISSGAEHRCERDLLDLICSAPATIEAEEGET